MNKGLGFPGHSSQPGLTSLLPLLSPPELLTERKGRPRFNRLTIGGGGHWRILSEAGHKGFGTDWDTAACPAPGVRDEEQVRWGQYGAEESPIVGFCPTPAKLHTAHSHLLSDLKYCLQWQKDSKLEIYFVFMFSH